MLNKINIVTDDLYLKIALQSLQPTKNLDFSLCIIDVDRMKSINIIYEFIRNIDDKMEIVLVKRNGFFSKWFVTIPFISVDNTVTEFKRLMKNPRPCSTERDVLLKEIKNFKNQLQLTGRQKTIFRLIKNTDSVWLISKKLNINIKTIYTHINAICEVYGAKNMHELYFFAQIMFA